MRYNWINWILGTGMLVLVWSCGNDTTNPDEQQDISTLTDKAVKPVKKENPFPAPNKSARSSNIWGDYLLGFIACKNNNPDKISCQHFTGMAINEVFGISDFKNGEEEHGYLKVYNIPEKIKTLSSWKKLGDAKDAEVLEHARIMAANQPVIAFNTTGGYSHVAIILPGEGVKSTSWGATVPKAVSFFHHNPAKSFVDKTLNYVWGDPDGVEIWVRKTGN